MIRIFRTVHGMGLALWLCSATVWGQSSDVTFKFLSIEHGLSQQSVSCIEQDHHGFLWAGTQDGLNRFDGHAFTIFRNDPDDSTSLSNNEINSICVDRDGHIWIGTGRGLNRWNSRNDAFDRIPLDPSGPDDVSFIFEESDTHLIVSADDILYRVDKTSGEAGSIFEKKIPRVQGIRRDRQGRMWLATLGEGVVTWDTETNVLTPLPFDPSGKNGVVSKRLYFTHEDAHGNVWIGTNQGLQRWSPSTGRWILFRHDPRDPQSLSSDRVYRLFVDRDSTWWIATADGLNVLDPATLRFRAYRTTDYTLGLNSNQVWNISQDRSGIVWFATQDGMCYTDPEKRTFQKLVHHPLDARSLPDGDVWAITEDRHNQLWIGTFDQGLIRLHRQTGQSKQYRQQVGESGGLRSNLVRALLVDASGRLWIGTWGGGLYTYDTATDRIRRFEHEVFKAPFRERIMTLSEDRQGRLWVGTDGGGLLRWDADREKVDVFQHREDDSTSLSDNGIRAIMQASSGVIWVATRRDLNMSDSDGWTWRRFIHRPDLSRSLSHYGIFDVHEDGQRRIWAATEQGLNLLEGDGFRRFLTKDGLPNEHIYAILEDDQSKLWLSTNKGLVRFYWNGETAEIDAYDESDGLPSHEFNQGAAFKNASGELFFGGPDGITYFRPSAVRKSTYEPRVVLTDFKLFNTSLRPDPKGALTSHITSATHVTLSPGQSVFSIEFAALQFGSPMKNRYAYTLEGFNDGWISTTARARSATYTNLDPGTYRFRVRATNTDGVWSPHEASLLVTVLPPFWQTWWFKIMGVLVLGTLIVGTYRRRVRRIEIQKRQLEEAVLRRTAEITLQKDEIAAKNLKIEKQAAHLQEINVQLEQAVVQLNKTKDQLVQSEKLVSLGQMVAGLAHEINNPLTFIQPNLEFIKDAVNRIDALIPNADPDTAAEWYKIRSDIIDALNGSLHGSERIRSIVHNMRSFSLSDSSQMAWADINEHLDLVVDLFQHAHQDIRIERELRQVPHIRCAIGDLNQCFVDLLDNAARAIGDARRKGLLPDHEGRIIVKTNADQPDLVRIHIADNGVGIPDSIRDRIFDPFFTTRDVGAGRGLGLSAVYGIVQRHHGSIDVRSQEGSGTEFILQLPTGTPK